MYGRPAKHRDAFWPQQVDVTAALKEALLSKEGLQWLAHLKLLDTQPPTTPLAPGTVPLLCAVLCFPLHDVLYKVSVISFPGRLKA